MTTREEPTPEEQLAELNRQRREQLDDANKKLLDDIEEIVQARGLELVAYFYHDGSSVRLSVVVPSSKRQVATVLHSLLRQTPGETMDRLNKQLAAVPS